MTFSGSLRDVALVARFELLRAIRTWRALALTVLYVVATAGGAYLFVMLLWALESAAASALGVPATDKPGTMMNTLVQGEELRHLVGAMVGDPSLVTEVLKFPLLAVFHLWFGLLILPFFAATASAESVALDLRSGALRFEVLRTGRLELVTGRFFGQAVLTLVASLLAISGTWIIGMTQMVGNDPIELWGALSWLTLRAWAFGLPFVGLGLFCSQITTSPAWARVLAVGTTAGTWVLYGVARYYQAGKLGVLCDVALQLLPQGWMRALWQGGGGWLIPVLVYGAIGLSMVAVGYPRFAKRDL